MDSANYHLTRTPQTTPVGSIGTLITSQFVNRAFKRISTGDLNPPVFFFSVLMGIAISIPLSLNPPNLIGKGSMLVGCEFKMTFLLAQPRQKNKDE